MNIELEHNALLQNGKYIIERKIGEGGFGITYKGTWKIEVPNPLGQTIVDYQVAIKEFFFQEYCSRNENTSSISVNSEKGKELFLKFKEKLKKEAAILLELEHPNIVNVSEVFEENNTAYMVMEFIDGENLKDIIDQKKRLDIVQATNYIKQIGEALQYIHQKNIIHLDVKPANILIDKSGTAKLIDFGIAKQYTDNELQSQSVTMAMFSKGYSPLEQYATNNKEKYGAHTDIYSLGATFYHCLTGEVPIEAAVRLSEKLIPPREFNAAIPDHIEHAILKAMELKHVNRFSSVGDFLEALNPQTAKNNKIAIEKAAEIKEQQITQEDNLKTKSTEKELDTKYLDGGFVPDNQEEELIVESASKKKKKEKKSKEQKEPKPKKEKTQKQPKATSNTPHKFLLIIIAGLLLIGGVIAAIIYNSNNTKNFTTSTSIITEEEIFDDDDIFSISEKNTTKTSETVSTKEVKEQEVAAISSNKTDTLSINEHTYIGTTKNGKPNGNGKLIFTNSDYVSANDVSKTIAESGDYIEGKWFDGELEYGTLYNKTGEKKKTIIIGR